MASRDITALAPLSHAELAGLAALWPKSSLELSLQVVEPMHVLSLRHLPGGGLSALSTAVAGNTPAGLPGPGRCCGIEPRLIWCSPNETLLLTKDARLASALLAALRPAPGGLACALDLSAGTLVVEMRGENVEALLSRLVDSHSLPREAGQASRIRLVDIAVVVWRDAPDRAGLLIDRANGHYLAQWLSYAADGMAALAVTSRRNKPPLVSLDPPGR
jgi:heterotetrameric sarcosine oxidase gamma subunit